MLNTVADLKSVGILLLYLYFVLTINKLNLLVLIFNNILSKIFNKILILACFWIFLIKEDLPFRV